MSLEHVTLVWQSGVDFGFKAGVVVGLVLGLTLAWLWGRWRQQQRR